MRAAAALVLALLLSVSGAAWAGRAVVDWKYDYVNVRSAPASGDPPIGRLARGTEAEVLEDRGDWVRVRYPGGQGWVIARSLRALPDQTVTAGRADGASGDIPSPVAASAPPSAERSAPAPLPSAGVGASPAAPAAPAARKKASPPTPSSAAPPQTEPSGGYLSRYTDERAPPPGDSGAGVIRLLSGLAAVLALLGAVVWVLRRFLGPRFLSGRKGGGIRVLATRSVGPRHGLLLVELEGLVWLLAQGPDGLRLISEIRDSEALRRLDERFGFVESPFHSELRRQLDSDPEAPAEVEERESERSDLTAEERLANLRRRPIPGEGP